MVSQPLVTTKWRGLVERRRCKCWIPSCLGHLRVAISLNRLKGQWIGTKKRNDNIAFKLDPGRSSRSSDICGRAEFSSLQDMPTQMMYTYPTELRPDSIDLVSTIQSDLQHALASTTLAGSTRRYQDAVWIPLRIGLLSGSRISGAEDLQRRAVVGTLAASRGTLSAVVLCRRWYHEMVDRRSAAKNPWWTSNNRGAVSTQRLSGVRIRRCEVS